MTDNLVQRIYEYVNQDAPDPRDFHGTYRVLFTESEEEHEVEMFWWESGTGWLEYPDGYLLDVGFSSYNPDHSRESIQERLQEVISARTREIESFISSDY
ncbi:hypothetical protein [Halolamina pelagica]|uniref:hypothetical protein n=1 Tax=Halolamina pelagica TaxID=699431 RepID=UPI001187548D|nr:hypothetical protein [Halolamina pelagica]